MAVPLFVPFTAEMFLFQRHFFPLKCWMRDTRSGTEVSDKALIKKLLAKFNNNNRLNIDLLANRCFRCILLSVFLSINFEIYFGIHFCWFSFCSFVRGVKWVSLQVNLFKTKLPFRIDNGPLSELSSEPFQCKWSILCIIAICWQLYFGANRRLR